MKRIRSRWIATVLCAVLLAAMFTPFETARAEGQLPVELTAPTGVSVEWMKGEDSANTCKVTFGKSEALTAWLAKDDAAKKEALTKLGYKTCKIFAQIDWALDDPTEWKYTSVWDSDTGKSGADSEHPNEFVLGEWAYVNVEVTGNEKDTAMILRYMGNPAGMRGTAWNDGYNGTYSKGWGSVIRTSQYSVATENGKVQAKIDFTKHTLFVRVRFGMALTKDGDDKTVTYAFSDWSTLGVCGKDADKVEYRLAEIFGAPQISDPQYLGKENTHGPFVSVKVTVPETITEAAKSITEKGGFVQVASEGRVVGDEDWTQLSNGDTVSETTELKWDISALSKPRAPIGTGSEIELRCTYYVYVSGMEFDSPESEVLTFKIEEADVTPTPVPSENATPTPRPTPIPSWKLSGKNPDEKKTCELCGMCPVQPLGVCLFVWMGGFVALIILISVIKYLITRAGTKKKKKPRDRR